MSIIERPQIDWSAAEIQDGTLTLALTGELPKGWGKRFEGVLALLPQQSSGQWGEVALHKGKIKVADVRQGSEAEVRHLLESVLLQVNSDLVEEPQESAASSSEEDPQREADRSMTETFRGFAEQEE